MYCSVLKKIQKNLEKDISGMILHITYLMLNYRIISLLTERNAICEWTDETQE